jgi:hypothetical protein
VMALLFADIRGVFLVRGVPILIAYVGLLIPFVATNLVSMVQAFLVVYPLFASPSQGLPCASLLYFREIIRVHKNADEYNQSLSNASLQGMLENATADIYLHCLGAARKYELLRSSTKWLIVSAVIWVLALAGTLLLS